MNKNDNISRIDELASSQNGVFTSKQAVAFGIPRYALSYAAKTGHIERICHSAYRLSLSIDSGHDELRALWMLTRPGAFAYDRLKKFDGIAVCSTTAAALHDIGDYFLSPYRIAVPERFNSRKDNVKYIVSEIKSDNVTWVDGLPTTTLERTIADLVLASEECSLVANVLVDAIDEYGTTTFNIDRLEELIGKKNLQRALANAGAFASGSLELVRTDSIGHVALKRKAGWH